MSETYPLIRDAHSNSLIIQPTFWEFFSHIYTHLQQRKGLIQPHLQRHFQPSQLPEEAHRDRLQQEKLPEPVQFIEPFSLEKCM